MLEQLINFKETFTYVYQFIIKDADEQPDEEIHKVKSGRVLGTGASVPMELGCTTLLACGHVHQPRSVLTVWFSFYGSFII